MHQIPSGMDPRSWILKTVAFAWTKSHLELIREAENCVPLLLNTPDPIWNGSEKLECTRSHLEWIRKAKNCDRCFWMHQLPSGTDPRSWKQEERSIWMHQIPFGLDPGSWKLRSFVIECTRSQDYVAKLSWLIKREQFTFTQRQVEASPRYCGCCIEYHNLKEIQRTTDRDPSKQRKSRQLLNSPESNQKRQKMVNTAIDEWRRKLVAN